MMFSASDESANALHVRTRVRHQVQHRLYQGRWSAHRRRAIRFRSPQMQVPLQWTSSYEVAR